jgi:hypothetical protein
VTEPPDPRHPLRDDGDQPPKYDDSDEVGLDDFFDTDWGQIERDDQMIDFLRTGDVTINDEAVPEEQNAADALTTERDRVDRAPFPENTAPDAVIAEYERRKKAAEPPGPRMPESGGQSRMINEGAQILANAATNADTVRGMVNSAEESVRSAAAALQEAIGVMNQVSGEVQTAAGGEEGSNLGGMGQQAVSELDQLLSAVAMFDPNAAMGYIGQFFDAVSQAAQKHGS